MHIGIQGLPDGVGQLPAHVPVSLVAADAPSAALWFPALLEDALAAGSVGLVASDTSWVDGLLRRPALQAAYRAGGLQLWVLSPGLQAELRRHGLLSLMQELERTSTDQRDTPVHDLRAVMIHSFIELSEDERLRKTMEIMLRSDASADTRVLTELQQAGFRDGLDRMERALRRAKDLGQLREGADPKIAARMLHATVLGVLHGAMVEPELMDLKRDGMLALDMTLAAYVKDGVFVPGTVPEPLPEA